MVSFNLRNTIFVALAFEEKFSFILCKWLHFHHLTSSIYLYFSVSLSVYITNQKLIISTKSFKTQWAVTFKKLLTSFKLQADTENVENAVFLCKSDIKINPGCGNCHHNKQWTGCTTPPKFPIKISSKHYQLVLICWKA